MAKDKLPKPIFFPEGTESAARPRFKELVAKKCYMDIYLISSSHWASRGMWIEFKLPELSSLDSLIEHHHNPKPKPWIPPAKPIRREEEEDEEGEE